MRSAYICKRELEHLLAALMPENRLALEISLATGLRISDVLGIKTSQLSGSDGRLTVRELKTGKSKRIRLPSELLERAKILSGRAFVFENRLDAFRPRTRQAVFKDLKRVAFAFKLKVNLAPHSMRKVFAVEQYKRSGCDLQRVMSLLNHSSEAVTLLYALADELSSRVLPPVFLSPLA